MNDPALQSIGSPDHGLTSTHHGRRGQIIAQALELASGGYDDVNVRLVAERAGVAVGTLYRHFPSKQHLLLSAFGEWLHQFEYGLDKRLGGLDDGFARTWQVLELLINALRDVPLLADTVARSIMYADESTAAEADRIRTQMADMFAGVLGGGWFTDSNRDIGAVLTDVLTSNLLGLAQQRITIDEVRERLSVILGILARRYSHAIRSVPASRTTRTSVTPRLFDEVDHDLGTHGERLKIV
jgi:AcrR family transcriptional regulator